MSSSEAVAGGATPEPLVIQHAPMSERQQLALIKRLEKDAQNHSNSDPSVLVSPPRAPLQVVTDANGANVGGHGNAGGGTAATSSTSSSAAESPSSNGTTPSTTSLRRTIFSQHQNGHSPTVDRLLKKISKKNTKGETPLHTAAIRGSTRLVHQLLQIGADPNVQDNAEWSPLHEACNRGNFSVVKVLHKFGADLNLKGFGKDSPLHDAARNGHLKVVKFLIKSGANIFAKNMSNRTPREEAEVTLLRISENEDLAKTVSFLIEYEEVVAQTFLGGLETVSSKSVAAATISVISSDSESDAEVENNDLAKFLGLSKSPVVTQALEILGFTPTTPASLNGIGGGIRNRQNMASGTDNSKSTPTSARSKGQANVLSAASNNTYTHCTTSKIRRLTCGDDGDTTTKKKATENLDCSSIKRIKMSPASETTVSKAAASTEEIEMKKVPPLKIVLPKTKVSGAGGGKEENEVNFKPKNLQEASSSSSSDDFGGFQNEGLQSFSSPGKEKQQQQQQSPLLLPPQQPFASSTSSSSSEPFEYYMKKRELRNPAVAVVLPQKRGHEHQQQQRHHHQPLKVVKDEEPHQRIPVEYHHQQQQQPSIANLQPLENDSSGDEYPLLSLLQNEPIMSEPLQDSWVPASTASPQKLVSEGNGRGGQAYAASLATRKRHPPSQLPAANIRQGTDTLQDRPMNDIEKYLKIRKRIELKHKNLFPVQPKPPEGFKDYLMNKKTYLLQENAHERLRSMSMVQPPSSLRGPLRDLFAQQEKERFKLRTKHIVEKEKLVLAVEQEILRVHGRAARALANQSVPFSVCTILRDEDVFNIVENPKEQSDDKTKDVRSRYNGRLFLSWLQDVDDKWERIKEQMVLRHHNEAESLNAVQKLDWEWKMNELSTGRNESAGSFASVDDLYVPTVRVSDDFALSTS